MFQMISPRLAVLALTGLVAVGNFARPATLCIKVTDPANLPLPDASVNALNLGTNKLFNGRSDGVGKACIAALPEGLYAVEVGLAGFLNVRYYPVRIGPVATHELRFRLPFGEITEGTLAQEATLSGTLRQGDTPVQNAKLCILAPETGSTVTCTVTNDLGEYAIVVPVGVYAVELRLSGGIVQRSNIDLRVAGFYRNRIAVARE